MVEMLIKFRGWLVRPKVWRYVCFASYVVASICYALSSSFTSLFGKRRWWMLLIYGGLNLLISLVILFATRLPQSWTNHWPKAHLVYLVWMITTVYSYFLDEKGVNHKPDAYSLISNAAFGVTSLGWSRHTNLGIENDFLKFFCGILTLQFMARKLWLGYVGLSYSACLIYLGFYFESLAKPQESNGTDNRLRSIVVNSTDSNLDIRWLMTFIKELENEKSNLITKVSQHALQHLSANAEPDVNLVRDTLPPTLINNLQEMVKIMVGGGAESQRICCDVYSSWRRQFLEDCLLRCEWQEINNKTWIQVCTVAVKILFPIEKSLRDCVFKDFSSATDKSFAEVAEKSLTETCRDLTLLLLNHIKTLQSDTAGHQENYVDTLPSETVSHVVDCIQASKELFPDLQSLFSTPEGESLRKKVRMAGMRLRNASRAILRNLEKLISRDMANAAVPVDGGIHPITREVMNHLCSFKTEPVSGVLDSTIHLLESKLEAKSKDYTDPVLGDALGYVFVINNLKHIKHKAEQRQIEIKGIWRNVKLQRLTAKVEYYDQLYRRASGNKLDHLFLEVEKMD